MVLLPLITIWQRSLGLVLLLLLLLLPSMATSSGASMSPCSHLRHRNTYKWGGKWRQGKAEAAKNKQKKKEQNQIKLENNQLSKDSIFILHNIQERLVGWRVLDKEVKNGHLLFFSDYLSN